MWQLTMLFGWIPTWFWGFTLALGVAAIAAAWFLSKIPLVTANRFAVQGIGIALTVISIWFLGAASNEEKWEVRMKELEEQVAKQESQAKDLNNQLQHEVEEKKQLAAQKQKVVIKEIEKWQTKEVLKEVKVEGPERVKIEKVVEYIENCPVPKEMLDIHNAAAKPPSEKIVKGETK